MQRDTDNLGTKRAEQPVVIQDNVIVGKMASASPANPSGEFSTPVYFGGNQPPDNENPEQTIDRLFNAINTLMIAVSDGHRKTNCVAGSNELLESKRNAITRLVTNEFFFYTREPLTMADFENLQERIAKVAKHQPENLHLVLGSFAVLTPDGKVMNVVPQVECGSNPTINLIVKSNSSSVDPFYRNYRNIDIRLGDDISNLGVNINGKHCSFSFDNVIKCKTSGGESFYSCIDICLDHAFDVAIKCIINKLISDATSGNDKIDLQMLCAHTVVSSSISLQTSVLGNITHADPQHSHNNCKQGVSRTKVNIGSDGHGDIGFGTPAHMYVVDEVLCDKLSLETLYKYLKYAEEAALNKAISENDTEKANVLFQRRMIMLRLVSQQKKMIYEEALAKEHTAIDGLFLQNAEMEVEKVLNEVDKISREREEALVSMNMKVELKKAISEGSIEKTKKILDSNPDLIYWYSDGLTPLLTAIKYGHVALIEPLLEYNPDPLISSQSGWSLLTSAIYYGSATIVEKLLIHYPQIINEADQKGQTPLEVALNRGNLEIAKLLIAKGAIANTQRSEGGMLLNIAIDYHDDEMLKLLLKHGADARIPNRNGWSPLNVAVYDGYVQIVETLLNHNPTLINEADQKGQTPLEVALNRGNLEIAKLLIEKGASVNTLCSSGGTLLSIAIYNRNEAMLELLLRHGADPSRLSNNGSSPLNMAIQDGSVQLVETLLNHYPQLVNVKNQDGKTPLEVAVACDANGVEMIKLLVAKGANDDLITYSYHLAVKNENDISDYKYDISDYKFDISDYKYDISDYKYDISDYKYDASDYKFDASDYKFDILNYENDYEMKSVSANGLSQSYVAATKNHNDVRTPLFNSGVNSDISEKNDFTSFQYETKTQDHHDAISKATLALNMAVENIKKLKNAPDALPSDKEKAKKALDVATANLAAARIGKQKNVDIGITAKLLLALRQGHSFSFDIKPAPANSIPVATMHDTQASQVTNPKMTKNVDDEKAESVSTERPHHP